MLSGPTHASWQAQVLRGCREEEDAIEINKRRSSKPADCEAWPALGLPRAVGCSALAGTKVESWGYSAGIRSINEFF